MASRYVLLLLSIFIGQRLCLANNGRMFERVRCAANGVVQCGLDVPTETHMEVTLGQCSAACQLPATDCMCFNFLHNNPDAEQGVCQLFDHQPQIGLKQFCTLYKVQ
jgi:hypothetical protein